MLRLFRKRKTTGTQEAPGQAQQWLAATITGFQKRWASFMQQWMERLSLRGKKVTVIAFCIVWSGYCFLILYRSFYNKKKTLFSITSIQQPAHITETGDLRIANDVIISATDYLQITQFRKYIDSLWPFPAGKRLADSILLNRPGLMDSIRQLEAIYKSQQQLKK